MSRILKRSHMCGVLNASDIGEKVVLNGWIAKSRRFKDLVFCDLRDKTGIVQLVFDSSRDDEELFEKAESLRSEYVVGIRGRVKERAAINKDIPTGDVEVFVDEMEIYSTAETPLIYIKDDDNVEEALRLKYRYLDLRKKKMQDNLTFRHRLIKMTRDFFDENGFTEVETPMLIKPTPEGARDYLVPSRISKGNCYALPQSPQMFKQLLMVAGTDRYVQIVKCFRDEDLRADRQPEFTQIDMELSFVDQEEVIKINEMYLKKVFKDMLNVDLKLPFPRMTYEEAMERYGSDKPDIRFGFELKSIQDNVKDTEFKVFREVMENGGIIRGICVADGGAFYNRKKIDKLIDLSKDYGAKGVVWIKIQEDGITSSVNKFFSQDKLREIGEIFDAKIGDLILICADRHKVVYDTLGFLRKHTASEMGLLNDREYKLLWIVDFPLFERDDETGELHPMHHPFTSPKEEDRNMLLTEPEKVRANAYDIVLNGVEIGGGSIRIHDKSLQRDMFKAIGISDEDIEQKFGFLIEAFRYGVPPHGGLAYGLDRLAMILLGADTIKEVIAFPKNQNAQCMVSEAPGFVDTEQLQELGLKKIDR